MSDRIHKALAPCPFCGSAAAGPTKSGGGDERNGYGFTISIACSQCGAEITTESHRGPQGWCDDNGQAEESVISKWQARAALDEGAEDSRDAARYRWLREQDWTKLGVVVTDVKNVRLGSDCPAHERLDAMIDAALEK